MHVELCSACHPFYTGKQKFVDAAGRVDKFRAKVEAAKAKSQAKDSKKPEKTEQKSNAEKLSEIKAGLSGTDKKEVPAVEIGEPVTSDEEIAAAEELAENNQ